MNTMSPLLLLALTLVPLIHAIPMYFADFHSQSCFDKPGQGYRDHLAPRPDSTASFALIRTSDGTPVSSVCPGGAYNLNLNFPNPPNTRVAFLLSSTTQDAVFKAPYKSECPNRVAFYVGQSRNSPFANLLTIACSAATAGAVTFDLTWATGSNDFYKQLSLTVNVDPSCATPACPAPVAESPEPVAESPAPVAESPEMVMMPPPMEEPEQMMMPPAYDSPLAYASYPPVYAPVYPPPAYPPPPPPKKSPPAAKSAPPAAKKAPPPAGKKSPPPVVTKAPLVKKKKTTARK